MTNDPSSGQPGGVPPRDRPEGIPSEPGMGETGSTPPASGGYTYTPPTGGGYSESQSSGEPTRDMSGGYASGGSTPSGGQPTEDISARYTPSGEAQGGYTPPPMSSSGYTPPEGGQPTQNVSGGYTPPPSGGYTPPPPPPTGGGYGAPPPPPRTTGGMDQAGMQNLFQSYMNAVTKPNVTTYEREIPNADWTKVLIGVGAVAVVSAIMALLTAGATAAYMDMFRNQPGFEDLPFDPGMFTGSVGVGGAISSLIFTFITFFLGAGLLWLMAKMFGGQNSDFLTHSYLLSLSYTPLRIIAAVLAIVPVLGGIVALVLTLYQLYSAGLAMQASQRMAPGRAQLAAFLPTIVGFLLLCLCVVLFIFGIAAAISGASNNP